MGERTPGPDALRFALGTHHVRPRPVRNGAGGRRPAGGRTSRERAALPGAVAPRPASPPALASTQGLTRHGGPAVPIPWSRTRPRRCSTARPGSGAESRPASPGSASTRRSAAVSAQVPVAAEHARDGGAHGTPIPAQRRPHGRGFIPLTCRSSVRTGREQWRRPGDHDHQRRTASRAVRAPYRVVPFPPPARRVALCTPTDHRQARTTGAP